MSENDLEEIKKGNSEFPSDFTSLKGTSTQPLILFHLTADIVIIYSFFSPTPQFALRK